MSLHNLKQLNVFKMWPWSAFKCTILFTYCGLVFGPNVDRNYIDKPILLVQFGKLSEEKQTLLSLPNFWPMNGVKAPVQLLLLHFGSVEILPVWKQTNWKVKCKKVAPDTLITDIVQYKVSQSSLGEFFLIFNVVNWMLSKSTVSMATIPLHHTFSSLGLRVCTNSAFPLTLCRIHLDFFFNALCF